MNAVLDFPATDTQAKPAELARIDLQSLALSRFGDWRPQAAALVAKYKDVVFDVATTKGLAEATAARAEVRAPRYAAQNVSKASKSELAKVSKAVGAEEQAIIDALAATEEHIDAQIRAEDDRKAAAKAERERIEGERVAAHIAGINTIRGYVAQAAGKTAAQIGVGLSVVERMAIGAEWEEFATAASGALAETLGALRTMQAEAQTREDAAAAAEAQRIEQARVAEEQRAEAKRLADERAEIERQRAELEARHAAEQRAREQEAARIAEQQRQQAAAEMAAAAAAQAKAAAKDYPEAQPPQQVLKAEPATADATDRGTAVNASPVGGPMGAGQAAAAAPLAARTNEPATLNIGTINDRLGFAVSVSFLADVLHIRPSATQGASRLYTELQFQTICAQLQAHIGAVAEIHAGVPA